MRVASQLIWLHTCLCGTAPLAPLAVVCSVLFWSALRWSALVRSDLLCWMNAKLACRISSSILESHVPVCLLHPVPCFWFPRLVAVVPALYALCHPYPVQSLVSSTPAIATTAATIAATTATTTIAVVIAIVTATVTAIATAIAIADVLLQHNQWLVKSAHTLQSTSATTVWTSRTTMFRRGQAMASTTIHTNTMFTLDNERRIWLWSIVGDTQLLNIMTLTVFTN
ncbi:hypothetical protein GQ42DRAFT_178334 [Ramicandelaber brevisporus]|nr:hypothetical protein GQ42DRAFT_178334 [Ramicandelaber brevisporus]